MGFINLAEKTVHAKLVYYGIGAGGKTTSLQAVHGIMCPSDEVKLVSINTEQDATLLFDFLPISLGSVGGFQIVIQGFTVPGQPKYKRMRKYVLQGADAVVLVVDSQRSRLQENCEALETLLENLRGNGIDPDKIPIVIQYNKRDLDDILSEEEMNPHFLIREDVQAFPSVATDDQGVYETFVHAAGQLVENKIRQYELGKGEVDPVEIADAARSKLWGIYDVWRDQREVAAKGDTVLEFTVEEDLPGSGVRRGVATVDPDCEDAAGSAPASEGAASDVGASEGGVDGPATGEDPPHGEPASEASSSSEPAAGESVDETPSSEAVSAEKPSSEKPWSEKPVGEKPVGEKPARKTGTAKDEKAKDRKGKDQKAKDEKAKDKRAKDRRSKDRRAKGGRRAGDRATADAGGDLAGLEADVLADLRAAEEVIDAMDAAGADAPAGEVAEPAAELFSDDDLDFDLDRTFVEDPPEAESSDQCNESGLLDMALQSNLQMAQAFGELDRYKAALRRKNEELIKFTQNTIHDLNKPLAAIKLMLTSVTKGYFGTPDGRISDAIQNSMAAVEMMERLTGDLMDSMVLDTSASMKFGEVDLGLLIADVLRTLRYNLEDNDVGVRVEPMPVIEADDWALTKAFMNLIGNAIQYASPDRVPRIWISYTDEDDFHRIVVADNGIGVPEGDHETLFLRFERGTNTAGISGTGLGLHIVKEAIMGHGGTIGLDSEEGLGTSFTIRLPKVPVAVPQSETTPTLTADAQT